MKQKTIKSILSMVLAAVMCFSLLPMSAFAADSDFTIKSGELTKYNGTGGSVTIPDNVTSIGYAAFAGASITDVIMPDSVTSIEEGAFAQCPKLTSVTMSKSITDIGVSAFSRCPNLTNITIPSSVKDIGDGAFYECTSLTSITLPMSVKSIGKNAFALNDGRAQMPITIYGVTGSYAEKFARNNAISFESIDFEIENGVLIRYHGAADHVVIPNHVTSIGEGAFAMVHLGIESITIPNSVTSIGDDAFNDCRGITSITIPDSVTSIGEAIFGDCTRLVSVTIPDSVTSIGDNMFFRTPFYGDGIPLEEMIIYGKTGSYAETYAKEQGVKFVPTSNATQMPTETEKPTSPKEPTTPTTPTEPTHLTSQLPGQEIQLTDEEFKWYVEFIGYLHDLKTIPATMANNRAARKTAKDRFAVKELDIFMEANKLNAETTVANAQKMLQRFPGEVHHDIDIKGLLDSIATAFGTLTYWSLDDYDFDKTVGLINDSIKLIEELYIGIYGPIDNTTPPTTDKPSAWAEAQVNTAITASIVPQALQGQYTQATTRAEFAALAVALYEKVKGAEITERTTFNDTTDINVQKAAAIGVVSGVGNNNFAPNDKLTREQAATMLSRLATAIGKPLTEQAATFADNGKVSTWAAAAVGQVQASGIMGGVGNNTFAPQADYTREQSILTALRLYDIVK